MHTTALIAEDEPLLAAALQTELTRAWPGLRVVAVAGDGVSAVAQALEHQPAVLFLDIRMPGMSGLEVAAVLADEWPDASTPFPALVFVTAYDQYAVEAFDAQAVDYLLKPVQPARLARTVERVQQRLTSEQRRSPAPDDTTLAQLRALLSAAGHARPAPLRVIQASVGNSIRFVPVDEVLLFEAADKYVRVLTAEGEVLIRTPLKELLPQLAPEAFWQVHRGTVVRVDAIHSVQRDETGRLSLRLHALPAPVPVSRLYAARFKAM